MHKYNAGLTFQGCGKISVGKSRTGRSFLLRRGLREGTKGGVTGNAEGRVRVCFSNSSCEHKKRNRNISIFSIIVPVNKKKSVQRCRETRTRAVHHKCLPHLACINTTPTIILKNCN